MLRVKRWPEGCREDRHEERERLGKPREIAESLVEVVRDRKLGCTLHRHLAAFTDDDAPAVRSCVRSCPFCRTHVASAYTLDKTADPNGVE